MSKGPQRGAMKDGGRARGGSLRIRLKAATRRLAPFRISHRRPEPWQPKDRDEDLAAAKSGKR